MDAWPRPAYANAAFTMLLWGLPREICERIVDDVAKWEWITYYVTGGGSNEYWLVDPELDIDHVLETYYIDYPGRPPERARGYWTGPHGDAGPPPLEWGSGEW